MIIKFKDRNNGKTIHVTKHPENRVPNIDELVCFDDDEVFTVGYIATKIKERTIEVWISK